MRIAEHYELQTTIGGVQGTGAISEFKTTLKVADDSYSLYINHRKGGER